MQNSITKTNIVLVTLAIALLFSMSISSADKIGMGGGFCNTSPSDEDDFELDPCVCDEDCQSEKGFLWTHYARENEYDSEINRTFAYSRYTEKGEPPVAATCREGNSCTWADLRATFYGAGAPEETLDVKNTFSTISFTSGTYKARTNALMTIKDSIDKNGGLGRYYGTVFKGFLYVIDTDDDQIKTLMKVDNIITNCFVGVSHTNRNWEGRKAGGEDDVWTHAYVGYSIYNHSTNDLVIDGERTIYLGHCRDDDELRVGSFNDTFKDDTWTPGLSPGIYEIYVVTQLDAAYANEDAEDEFYLQIENDNIYRSELTYEQFTNAFDDVLDDSEFFCTHYNEVEWLSDEDATANDVTTNRCCGDDETDATFISGNARCLQNGDGTFSWDITEAKDYCEDLTLFDNAKYIPGATTTIENISEENTGLDACCGDDNASSPLSDHTYLYPDNQWLCDKDLSSGGGIAYTYGAGTLWNWWNALDHFYKIHTASGSDMISNSHTWQTCDATDTNSENDIWGAYETLKQPTGGTGSFCVEAKRVESHPVWSGQDSPFLSHAFLPGNIGSGLSTTDPSDSEVISSYESYIAAYQDDVGSISPYTTEQITNGFLGYCYISGQQNYLFGNDLESALQTATNNCDSLVCITFGDSEPIDPDFGDGGANWVISDKNNLQINKQQMPADCAQLEHPEYNYGIVDTCGGDTPYCGEEGIRIVADNNDVCCAGDTCVAGDPRLCEDYGGEIVPDNDFFVCPSGYVETPDTDRCCIGGYTTADSYDTEIFRDYEAFKCYEGVTGESFIAECCSEASCYNNELITATGYLGENGRLFGTGKRLGSFLSFDKVFTSDDRSGYFDGVLNITIDSLTPGEEHIEQISANLYDPSSFAGQTNMWYRYDYVEFDVLYTGIGAGRLKEIALGNSRYNLAENSLLQKDTDSTNLLPNVWHRVRIPIGAGLFVNDISFIVQAHQSSQGAIEIYTDNFVLVNNDSTNYYCSGKYKGWISGDLSTQNDRDEDTDAISPIDYLPEMEACNAQLSFSWTGERCCGSTSWDTPQYYVDKAAACYGGITLKRNQRVSDAYGRNLAKEPNVLFARDDLGYDTFWLCNTTQTETSLNEEEFIDSPLTDFFIREVLPFTIVNNWYCDASIGDTPMWRSLDNFPRTKLLASKMYGEANEDFDLHCDDYDALGLNDAFNSMGLLGEGMDVNAANTSCVLKNYADGDVDSISIGITLGSNVDVNDVLSNITNSFQPFAEEETIAECELYEESANFIILEGEGDEFFRSCSLEDDELQITYNQPLNLLILSYQGETTGGFFQNIWNSLSNFFGKLFGSSQDAQAAGLPVIPVNLDVEDFEHLYFSQRGSLQVLGTMATFTGDESTTNDDTNYVRIDYDNLSVNLSSSILDSLQQLQGMDAKICVDNYTQTLFINYQLTSVVNNFFDWRYLTSGLRLNDTGTANRVQFSPSETNPDCYLHNGKVDHEQEQCDDTLARYGQAVQVRLADGTISSDSTHTTCPNGMPKTCINGKIDSNMCDINSYYLFVTKQGYQGDLGGLQGADEICRQAAKDSLSDLDDIYADGTKAFIANSQTNPADRFNLDANLSEPLASNPDRMGTVRTLLEEGRREKPSVEYRYENGGNADDARPWTGLTSTGASNSYNCNDWQSSTHSTSIRGAYGRLTINYNNYQRHDYCSDSRPIICLAPVSSTQNCEADESVINTLCDDLVAEGAVTMDSCLSQFRNNCESSTIPDCSGMGYCELTT